MSDGAIRQLARFDVPALDSRETPTAVVGGSMGYRIFMGVTNAAYEECNFIPDPAVVNAAEEAAVTSYAVAYDMIDPGTTGNTCANAYGNPICT